MKLTQRPITKKPEKLATTTAIQHRTQLFLPINQYKQSDYATRKNVIRRESKYGVVEFRNGCLTALHCDIVEILLSKADKYETHFSVSVNDKGRKQEYRSCRFTAHQLAKDLKIGDVTRKWILDRLWELRDFSFRITPNKGLADYTSVYTGILNNVYDNYEKNNSDFTIEVNFSPEFLDLWKYDMCIHTEKATDIILNFDKPWIRQFIRYCFTHEKLNETLDSVFFNIGITTERVAKRLNKENISSFRLISNQMYYEYRNMIKLPQMKDALSKVFIYIKWSNTEEDFVVFYDKNNAKELVWSERPKLIKRAVTHKNKEEPEELTFEVNLNFSETYYKKYIRKNKELKLFKKQLEEKMKNEKRIRLTSEEDEKLDNLQHEVKSLEKSLKDEKELKTAGKLHQTITSKNIEDEKFLENLQNFN